MLLLMSNMTCATELSSVPPELKLAVGQEWSIKSSPASATRIVIGRIEPWRDKVVVHVSILNVVISANPTMTVSEIAHAPFEESALARSLDQMTATSRSPSSQFESGYAQWKEQHGGIYTVTVSEMISLAIQTLNQHQ